MLGRALEGIFRAESGRVLATLIRLLGDFQLAEDALQDAFFAALENWPQTGLPASPGAWLTTTARRKALDRLRHQKNVRIHADALEALIRLQRQDEGRPDQSEPLSVPDDRLRLIFTCCHPALSPEAQIALTLKTLGGLSTPEIARALLVSETTLAQRLVRAKNKIRQAKIPYEIPAPEVLPERLEAVLAVIYLIFNEGYLATQGTSLMRRDLTKEAIRLARVLYQLLPAEPEVEGLLALLLLQDSRSSARLSPDGALILLEDQNRSLWDKEQIAEGLARTEAALKKKKVGPYQLQAAIAALHAEAPSAGATDWVQIALLYDELYLRDPQPVVGLNRVVAWSMSQGPQVGLVMLEALVGRHPGALDNYAAYHLARADFYRRLGDPTAAAASYRAAATYAENEAVKNFVAQRLNSA